MAAICPGWGVGINSKDVVVVYQCQMPVFNSQNYAAHSAKKNNFPLDITGFSNLCPHMFLEMIT